MATPQDTTLLRRVTTYDDISSLPRWFDSLQYGERTDPPIYRCKSGCLSRRDYIGRIRRQRAYSLGADARKVIDDTFDKLHEQGRMSWSSQSKPFGYPVFGV